MSLCPRARCARTLRACVLASYELAGAGYSPKKLRAVARELKGSVYSALFFLRFLRKRPVAKLLTEFLTGVYCDVRTKHA